MNHQTIFVVRITGPTSAVLPDQDRVGTWLLLRTLELAMQLGGVRVTESACFFPLNRALLLYVVNDYLTAVDIVRMEGKKLGIGAFLQFARHDAEHHRCEPLGDFAPPTSCDFEEDARFYSELIRTGKAKYA